MQNNIVITHKYLDYTGFSCEAADKYLQGASVESIDLFYSIRSYINRFVYLTDERHLDLITLWVIGTYLFPVFRYYPYLWLNADKGSGKTTLLEVIEPICYNGQILISPTPAVLFRDIETNRPTLLIDEFEHFRKQDKETAGALTDILNAGYNSEGRVKRVEPSKDGSYRVRTFSAYSPKVLAGINNIDPVLRDRTIQVRMLRKSHSEPKERYKADNFREAHRKMRDDCCIFALRNSEKISTLYNSDTIEIKYLAHLSNRELDLWEALASIAHIIDSDNIFGTGFLGLISSLAGLSKDLYSEKVKDYGEEDDTTVILLALKEFLGDSEDKLCKFDMGLSGYRASDVLSFINGSGDNFDDFVTQFEQKTLTNKLKSMGITWKQLRWEGKAETTYFFDEKIVSDLMSRFNVNDIDNSS